MSIILTFIILIIIINLFQFDLKKVVQSEKALWLTGKYQVQIDNRRMHFVASNLSKERYFLPDLKAFS